MIDLMAGQLQLIFATAITAMPQVQAKKVRALAVTTLKRAAIAPELPTMIEAGVPGFEVNNWYAVVAPRETPPDVIRVLNRETVAALTQPEVKEQMAKLGLEPAPSTPEALGAYIKSEMAKWQKVVQASGARAD